MSHSALPANACCDVAGDEDEEESRETPRAVATGNAPTAAQETREDASLPPGKRHVRLSTPECLSRPKPFSRSF